MIVLIFQEKKQRLAKGTEFWVVNMRIKQTRIKQRVY